jgi:hypothetical protein
VISGLPSWLAPLQALVLVASPRLRLRQVVYIGLNFGDINEEFLHHLLGFLTYPLGDMVKMEYQVQGHFIYIIIYVSDCVRNTKINTKWGLLAKIKPHHCKWKNVLRIKHFSALPLQNISF